MFGGKKWRVTKKFASQQQVFGLFAAANVPTRSTIHKNFKSGIKIILKRYLEPSLEFPVC